MALNTSVVVAARGMDPLYSYMGICQGRVLCIGACVERERCLPVVRHSTQLIRRISLLDRGLTDAWQVRAGMSAVPLRKPASISKSNGACSNRHTSTRVS